MRKYYNNKCIFKFIFYVCISRKQALATKTNYLCENKLATRYLRVIKTKLQGYINELVLRKKKHFKKQHLKW